MPTLVARTAALAATFALLPTLPLPAHAQASTSSPELVQGSEMQSWLDSDGMAVAGMFLRTGCYFMAQGPGTRRQQSVKCPGMEPFVVTGEARVEGNRFCSKFRYPDGVLLDLCQDVIRIGDNKYQMRGAGSQPTTIFYRLLP
jgi:hypothetical protein